MPKSLAPLCSPPPLFPLPARPITNPRTNICDSTSHQHLLPSHQAGATLLCELPFVLLAVPVVQGKAAACAAAVRGEDRAGGAATDLWRAGGDCCCWGAATAGPTPMYCHRPDGGQDVLPSPRWRA
ncbi:hypothetical protein CLOP_g9294 [Closterium sp. NIES-67]|nr:hypothetical protein CLOP_g9294 [Closterium sp. NIES-67]